MRGSREKEKLEIWVDKIEEKERVRGEEMSINRVKGKIVMLLGGEGRAEGRERGRRERGGWRRMNSFRLEVVLC